MVGANLKGETLKLMEKRSGVEAEMNAIIENLTRPGGPGLSGNLLDSEGFPRGDVDIPVARAQRRRLAELRNDHREITDKINENIQVLHLARVASKSSAAEERDGAALEIKVADASGAASSPSTILRGSPTNMDLDVVVSRPFAIVDEIADGSPAAEDGLQLGDQIIKFGRVEAGDNLLQRLASESQENLGHAVALVAIRQGAIINLMVTPRAWQGRGLLGCHFHIL